VLARCQTLTLQDWGGAVQQRWLFIVGCARSGTTAMMRLLNSSASVCLFNERYTRLFVENIHRCSGALFAPARVVDVRPGDSFTHQGYLKKGLDYGGLVATAAIVGDKSPRVHALIPSIRRQFPGCRFLFMVRDIVGVANSFEGRADEGVQWKPDRRTESAIVEWNRALASLKAFWADDIIPILYEDFFYGPHGRREIEPLLGQVAGDLDWDGAFAEAERIAVARVNRLGAGQRARIGEAADRATHAALCERFAMA
jgi:hypothetical protein